MKIAKTLSIISGIMLLLAVPSIWPYGYYQVLRWVVSLTGVINAHRAYKENLVGWSVSMMILAIIFNPISPIAFSKGTWVIIDILAAIILFVFSHDSDRDKDGVTCEI